MNPVQNNDQEFSTLDRQRFSELLLKQYGLHFSETRWTELDHAIRYAFAASTCSSLEEYYHLLSNTHIGTVEMDRLVNAVTVNETHFFRDDAQFNALYQFILPRIIERKRPVRTLRIWSAGCSSGEEPYSLAILLRELLPDIDQWSITILGTDINTASLERAYQAVYGNWAFREERAKLLRSQYFRVDNGRFSLVPEVRRMVLFKRLNLVEPCYPSYETNTMLMDLILCRNVTIYFNEQITRWIIDRFYDALVDGGWLVVGHSEPSIDTYHRFRVRNFTDTLAYQKSPETAGLKWPSVKPVAPAPIPLPPLPRLDMAQVNAGPRSPQPEASRPILSLENGSKEVDPLIKVMELLDYGRSDEARIGLLAILKDRPRDAKIHALLGKVFANLGQWDEAERWCLEAIAIDKLILEAYYTLALVMQHKGLLPNAIEAMKKVVYLDRAYVLGHYGLGNLYFENNQLPQAQKSLDNALKLLISYPAEIMVPGSNDITVGRLREAIIRHQQAWSAV